MVAIITTYIDNLLIAIIHPCLTRRVLFEYLSARSRSYLITNPMDLQNKSSTSCSPRGQALPQRKVWMYGKHSRQSPGKTKLVVVILTTQSISVQYWIDHLPFSRRDVARFNCLFLEFPSCLKWKSQLQIRLATAFTVSRASKK